MRNSRLLISLVLVAVVVLLNLPAQIALRIKSGARDNIAPFQSGFSVIFKSWSENISALFNARNFAAERVKMIEEIASLKHEIRQLQSIQDQNDELRRHAGFQKQSKYGLVLCEVIARGDAIGWWQTITLNKGSADGIEPNRAVITTEGLVGMTMRVGENTADVLLIVDYNCKVACKIERTGSLGILRGGGVSVRGDHRLEMLWSVKPPEMQYINKDHQVQEGDRVVTSGLGGVYPAGLPIGYIKKVKFHPSDLFYSAEIELLEDLDVLEYVFVVKGKPGGSSNQGKPDATAKNVVLKEPR